LQAGTKTKIAIRYNWKYQEDIREDGKAINNDWEVCGVKLSRPTLRYKPHICM
jgi:hypothetical protein